VWNGHSCPLSFDLDPANAPSMSMEHDREGHDIQSFGKARTTVEERRFSAA
jgi:hypothetical protein